MSTRDLVLTALFTAIIIVLGIIPPITLAFVPVPITAQSMGVMLAGCIIGAKRGALAYLLLILMVAVGLPVLSGGRGGLAVLAGPTGGYIAGWVLGTFVTGLIAERIVRETQGGARQIAGFFLASIIGGIGVVYLMGTIWLAINTGMGFVAALSANVAFLPGDLIKAGIAALAARAVLVGYPLLPQRA
ncbi:biotin transporter BioY [Rhizobium sp. 9140]|uniref:biotin transporter BioY n=1 Tax=Rhizobium sp. 9140 TaxID=1761900 RepID=UPI0007923987|nr:biotin transporter BioY [Rhizobium sp. 9140]CZT34422.1 biotin transport system substrate-specific component [Rhizobium sp. 9140]